MRPRNSSGAFSRPQRWISFYAGPLLAVLAVMTQSVSSAAVVVIDTPARELDAAAARAETFAPQDIEAMAKRRGMSLARAEYAMRLESATVGLEEQILTAWPDSYAGMWLSTTASPSLVLAFTDADPSRSEVAGAWFGFPASVDTVVVDHSLDELATLQLSIREERSRLQRGGRIGATYIDATRGHFDLDIDVRANRVVVYVEKATPQISTAFTDRWGGGRVIVREGVIRPQCTQNDCYATMMGGLTLQKFDLVQLCTTGFSALDGSGSGQRYVLSAAHCDTTSRYHADYWFGEVWDQQQSGRVDAERIIKGNSVWDMKGKVWLGSSDKRSIYTYITWGNMTVGTQVTKSGWFGGIQVGDILSKNYMPNAVPNSERFLLASYCGTPGDSGGGIVRNNTAYGIHHGNDNVLPHSACPTPENSVFGAINYAMTALDVDLMAGP